MSIAVGVVPNDRINPPGRLADAELPSTDCDFEVFRAAPDDR